VPRRASAATLPHIMKLPKLVLTFTLSQSALLSFPLSDGYVDAPTPPYHYLSDFHHSGTSSSEAVVRTNKSARLHVRVIGHRTSSVAPNVLRYIDVVTTTSTCFASICVYRHRAKEPDRTKTVHHLEEEHSQLKMSDDKKREAKRVAAENGV
jgi:hypothetical protein